jgi:inosine-uridine nucleoside N-ribohydrolase
VDYSPTVSDVGGLLYLLSHPGVEVLAITLPVTGEAGCELGLEVTLGILAMLEREDVPVACDPEFPLDAEDWPPEFLAGHEALASGLPDATTVSDVRPAYQLIAEVASEFERPVTLYAVAPLTNVARALDHFPGLTDELDRIVVMGGAVDVRGNVGPANAEWNFWIDVPAAARVLGSGAQVTLVSLDATNDVPVPGSWLDDLQESERSEPVKYLSTLVEIFPNVTSGFFYMWDELAASVAAGEGLITSEERMISVAERPGADYGRTVPDPAGSPIVVSSGVPDPERFYEHFLLTLSRTEVVGDE